LFVCLLTLWFCFWIHKKSCFPVELILTVYGPVVSYDIPQFYMY